MIKSGIKRGQCWKRGCIEKYVITINLKLIHGKYREELEFRACKNHFKDNWERLDIWSYKNRIEEFLK